MLKRNFSLLLSSFDLFRIILKWLYTGGFLFSLFH